jgi:sugar lactone lactonase YvrE
MWFADSAQPCIVGFEYNVVSGHVGVRQRVVPLQDTSGLPDGLCVDDEGGIWLALWGGSAVHRYMPDGRLDTVICVPTRHVTSCAFGGPDCATLWRRERFATTPTN